MWKKIVFSIAIMAQVLVAQGQTKEELEAAKKMLYKPTQHINLKEEIDTTLFPIINTEDVLNVKDEDWENETIFTKAVLDNMLKRYKKIHPYVIKKLRRDIKNDIGVYYLSKEEFFLKALSSTAKSLYNIEQDELYLTEEGHRSHEEDHRIKSAFLEEEGLLFRKKYLFVLKVPTSYIELHAFYTQGVIKYTYEMKQKKDKGEIGKKIKTLMMMYEPKYGFTKEMIEKFCEGPSISRRLKSLNELESSDFTR
ncbi:MAG: hypothetical protein JW812_02075 [Alphaproteobacteria bacterium]|nr:hypothetical protein [Alphaproteobacteria bacterium]MBN2779534.1 hypothetical protein [Alphaproteobacteria bacterium]